jgi:Domain of unknown function (DUF4136)
VKFAPIAAALALALAACTNAIQSDVVGFGAAPKPAGERVVVLPSDPRLANSLEFESYRKIIEEELLRVGYTPVRDSSGATIRASVSYTITRAADEVIESWPDCYPHFYFRRGYYRDPIWYRYDCWAYPAVTVYPKYLRELTIDLDRSGSSVPERLYEGHVHSLGSGSNLGEIVPYMIIAMFRNFPEGNGRWRSVTITEDEIAPPRSSGRKP